MTTPGGSSSVEVVFAIVSTQVHAVSVASYGRMIKKSSTELSMCTGQIGLRSCEGYTQRLCDFTVAHPFNVMENYRCPSAFWQASDCTCQGDSLNRLATGSHQHLLDVQNSGCLGI